MEAVRHSLFAGRHVLVATTLWFAPIAVGAQAPELTGTWRVDAGADVGSGPREVIIRPDSSASWGRETVRWRRVANKIWIAIGGEWEIYDLRLRRSDLSLSGGDLTRTVTLRRVGAATPLPAGKAVPPPPGSE